MMAEIVGGIVGGAHGLDAELLRMACAVRPLRSAALALFQMDGGRFLIEQLGDSEIAL